MDPTSPLLDFDTVLFDRYRLLEPLRKEAPYETWKARNTQDPLSGAVALKILTSWGAAAPAYQEKVRVETRKMQGLVQPPVQAMLGFLETGPLAAAVYPLLRGDSFLKLMGQLGTPPAGLEDLRKWLPPLCARLDELAEHRLLHRRITPGNLLQLVDGSVVLMDFGLGHFQRESGIPISPAETARDLDRYFLAPERRAGAPGGIRSDIFSLAGVIYYLLTLEWPTPLEAASSPGRISEERRSLAAEFAVEPDPDLEAWEPFLLRGLHPDPMRRPARFTDLLQGWIAPAPAGAPAASTVGLSPAKAQILAQIAASAPAVKEGPASPEPVLKQPPGPPPVPPVPPLPVAPPPVPVGPPPVPPLPLVPPTVPPPPPPVPPPVPPPPVPPPPPPPAVPPLPVVPPPVPPSPVATSPEDSPGRRAGKQPGKGEPEPIRPARKGNLLGWVVLGLVLLLGGGAGYWWGVQLPAQREAAARHAAMFARIEGLTLENRATEEARLEAEVAAFAEGASPDRVEAVRTRWEARKDFLDQEAARVEAERRAAIRTTVTLTGLPSTAGGVVKSGGKTWPIAEDGTATIPDLGLGQYAFTVEVPGFLPGSVPVTVGNATPLEIMVENLQPRMGKFSVEGVESGFWVHLIEAGAYARIDAEGVVNSIASLAAPGPDREDLPLVTEVMVGSYVAILEPPEETAGEDVVPVEIEEGKTFVLEYRRPRGTLTLRSQPAGAEVWLDGKSIGKTPVEAREFLPGKMIFLLKYPNFQDTELVAEVGAGEKVVLQASLLPVPPPEPAPAASGPGRKEGAQPAPTPFQPAKDYYPANELEVRPRVRQAKPPQYPARQLRAGTSGRVVARIYVNSRGGVDRVEIEKSTHRDFTRAVEEAVSSFSFEPAQIQGVPVGAVVQQEFEFNPQ